MPVFKSHESSIGIAVTFKLAIFHEKSSVAFDSISSLRIVANICTDKDLLEQIYISVSCMVNAIFME